MAPDVSRSLEFTFTCTLPSGLHARPASHLADLANKFASDSALTNLRNGLLANAKSVLAIISADVRQGDECRVRVSGADDEVVYTTLRQFIEKDLPSLDETPAEFLTNGHGRALPRSLRQVEANCHFGVGVSRGIAQGKVVSLGSSVLPDNFAPDVNQPSDLPHEQEKIERAIAAVRARIEALLLRQPLSTEAAILKAHLAIAGDISLKNKMTGIIAEGRSAGQAIVEAGKFFIDMLRRSESFYIRERAIDMQEVCSQLLEEIYGAKFQSSAVALQGPSIVVAETLGPQQLLALDRTCLKALVLESAGLTSHVVILARSLGIPALVGVKDASLVLTSGEEVIVDAVRGVVLRQPTPQVERFYERELAMQHRRWDALSGYALRPAVTSDGQALEIGANVSSSAEVVSAFEKGADGIGLFRTEMLFVERESLPSEQEQFEAYSQSVRAASGRPVIIRTIDIGGDKPVPHLGLEHEANPFLGYRGVRIYAEHEELIHTQFRAILRASAFGPVRMMVPMVSSLEEVLWIKAHLAHVQEELKSRSIAFDSAMQIGIMIEVPSVAFILDQLCQELDFFSIGTNDLAQYFLAVDRDNPKVARLSDVRHPGFVRFLKHIVEQVHNHGKWIGMCGEMASDIRHLPLLLALGLDEISATASEIPTLKEKVSRLSGKNCKELLLRVLICRETAGVEKLLEREPTVQSAPPLLDRELVIFDSESANKEEAVRELANALYVAGRTADPDGMEEAIWAREAVYSTGVGHGFAVPHCKTDAVLAGSLGIMKLKKPIAWDSPDGEPVQMVILLAFRESEANARHMQVFSRLARKLMNEEFREALGRRRDTDSILAYLAEQLNLSG